MKMEYDSGDIEEVFDPSVEDEAEASNKKQNEKDDDKDSSEDADPNENQ